MIDKTLLMRFIGAKVAYFRTIRGLTQVELAEKINVSKSTIGRIERGQYNDNVSYSMLVDIANGLHVSLHALTEMSHADKKMQRKLKKKLKKENKSAKDGQDTQRTVKHGHDTD